MSRLQVGGLALIIKGEISDINVGKVVTLISFHGDDLGYKDLWQTSADGLVFNTADGKSTMDFALIPQDRLMPLGDKQTQDELLRESELEKA